MGHFAPALPYSAEELRGMGFDIAGGKYVTPLAADETDVLFLEDPRKKGYFHPRIAAQNTRTFASLESWQKDRFNDLYNDFSTAATTTSGATARCGSFLRCCIPPGCSPAARISA